MRRPVSGLRRFALGRVTSAIQVGRLLAVAVMGAVSVSAATDLSTERAEKPQPTRSVVYKEVGSRKLRLFLFEPEGHQPTDKRPCFLLIHGGGWAGGDPTVVYKYAEHFARQGMLGVSLEYRLMRDKNGLMVFDCVKDGRSAVRYLREHADELGIDPDRIVVGGGSAGGHVSAGTALFDGIDEDGDNTGVSCVPNALVLLYAVLDTSAKGYGHSVLGGHWRELSPLLHVKPGLPPALMFHCTGDTTCPITGARQFHEAMVRAGNRCDYVEHKGGGHSSFRTDPELYRQSLDRMEAFFAETGILKAAPSSP